MKFTRIHLMIVSTIAFGLYGCSSTGIARQVTSLNIAGCKTDEAQITHQKADLDGTLHWTAKCNGKTYTCNYLDESMSNCYESSE